MRKNITRNITGSGKRAAQSAVRSSTRAASRVPGVQGGYARAVAVLGAGADGTPRRQVSEILLRHSAGGPAQLINRAGEGGYLTPEMLEQAAHIQSRAGEQEYAAEYLREAYRIDPSAVRAVGLAQALSKIQEKGPSYDEVLGLTLGKVPARLDEIFTLLDEAEGQDPGNIEVLHAAGLANAYYGDARKAVEYLRAAAQKSPTGEWLSELAAACMRSDVADYEQAFATYERAHAQEPENAGHVTGLVAAGLRAGVDRTRIWRTVRQLELSRSNSAYKDKHAQELVDKVMAQAAGPKGVGVALKRLRELGARGRMLHPASQELIASQLLHMGYVQEGYQVRVELAVARAERLSKSSIVGFGTLNSAVRALVYTGDYDQAAQLSEPRLWGDKGALTRRKVEKLHAEVQLLRGNVDPYQTYSRAARERLPLESDRRLGALVRGKKVAVLPATRVDQAAEYSLESYDVVVVAGLRVEQVHGDRSAVLGQNLIGYVGEFPSDEQLDDLTAAVDAGRLKLAVVPALSIASERDDHVRPLRHGFSVALFGELSDVGTAVYDLLQFEPESLTLLQAGVDDRDESAREQLRNAMGKHDSLFDLQFLKALNTHGLVKAGSSQAQRNLGFSDTQYLKTLTGGPEKPERKSADEVSSPEAQARLERARALLNSRRRGIVTDPVRGLTTGYVRNYEGEALAELDAALDLAPGDPVLLYEKGLLLFERGAIEDGLAHLEVAVAKKPHGPWLREMASAYRRPHVARFEQALSAYERAFQKNSKDRRSLLGIVNIGVRGTLDWPRVWQSARQLELKEGASSSPYWDEDFGPLLDRTFRPDATGQEVQEMLQLLDALEARGRSLQPDVLGFLATRLQFMGHLGAGYALRAKLARQKSASVARDFNGLRHLVKALVYLGDYDRAASLSEVRFWPEADPATLRKHEKVHAEAQLMRGHAGPYIEYSEQTRAANPLPADDAMEELVRGKRVAIVGPVDTGDQLGSLIDDYDVIVRPRFNPDFVAHHTEAMGSRTDIVYINGQDLEDDIPQMARAVEEGSLKLAVARPLSYHLHHERELSWLRFYRQDFGLHFHGFALGLQRFAYDILQFDPAEIGIFNTDMYTGSDAFASGYRDAKDIGFKPGSIMNDLIVNHDLLFDFKYMRALEATGIVTLHGKAEEVGHMDPDDYVKAMEAGGALQ